MGALHGARGLTGGNLERTPDGRFDKTRRPLYYRLEQIYAVAREKWKALMDEKPALRHDEWMSSCDKRDIWRGVMLEAAFGMREIERGK